MPPPSVTTATRPAVTVAVVVKDRLALMGECLASLAVQDHPSYDVLVVDNGSTDGTFEMLQSQVATFAVPLTVIQVQGPLGLARQFAAAQAAAGVIAFTDSDCVAEPGWLSALTGPLGEGCDGVDVVQGHTEPAQAPTGSWPRTVQIRSWSDLYETCNIAYRRDRLLAAGGFPCGSGLYAAEDTTAGWQVRRLGGEHRFAADAIVRHAVTYPGVRWHLGFAKSFASFPVLVAQFPEMRRELLTRRVFLRPRSAAFDAAALGLLLLAARKPAGALLLAPYLRHVREAWRGERSRGVARAVAYDTVAAASLVRGSVRAACPVL
jgi:glycosyltransferase involved in cell wall biosynthesis